MSIRTVAEKLGIKPDTTVWSSPPSDIDRVGTLPAGVRRVDHLEDATTAFVFAPDAAAVRTELDRSRDAFAASGAFWVAYPKGNRSDINRDSLWPILVGYDMRPVSQIAIDETWSAMKFRARREGEAPFTGGGSR